jgi:DNA excision repair protein ERCC-6
LLLRDVVAFLRARPEGRAPSGLVVDAFQDRVGPTQHALFRRLLKVAATLEKNPPNAAGRGGGAAWVLKDEFR